MKRPLILAAALAAAVIGGCYESDATAPRPAGATTRVFLTDDPFPFDTVARVDLYIESIAINASADTSTDADWVTVATPNARFNLLDFQNGAAALLDSAAVPAGEYAAVRVIIDTDSSRIVATTGAEMNINWQSSAGEPSLYAFIEKPIGIADTGGAVVIDFDVGRSFFWQTTENAFTFSPVLRAVEQGATGSIAGHFNGTGLHNTIAAYGNNGALRATTRTDEDGDYVLAYLVPGTYDVRFEPQPGEPQAPAEVTVAVAAGETVTADLTPGQCSIEGCGGFLPPPDSSSSGRCEAIASCDTTTAPPDTSVTDSTVTDSTVTDSSVTDSTVTDTTGIDGAVARIVVAPDTSEIAVGATVRLTATAFDARGNAVPNVQFAWAAGDSAVASVTQDGVVRGLAPGVSNIFAIGARKSGAAAVFVKQP